MNISVFGLGYVGTVTVACLAARNHRVMGVDVAPPKVQAVTTGSSPVVEPGLADLIQRGVRDGRIQATTDARAAVEASDLSIVCVGTPSRSNGSQNLDQVLRVTEELGAALRAKRTDHCVVYRSTLLPGTTESHLIPLLERAAGRRLGDGLGVAVNPEFLREGTALADFERPPRTVIGASDPHTGRRVAHLFEDLDAPLVMTSIRLAEMVKFADNAFHALKITFANEVGMLCRATGIDAAALMEVFCLDTKLNLSRAYLRPGGPFGGSCLPKDLRALLQFARQRDVPLPVLDGVLSSNELQKRLALESIVSAGRRRIGFLGLAFKPGTDDLRESPAVGLAESLIGKGYHVLVYDPSVELSRLMGANLAYIEREIPHIAAILRSTAEDILTHAEVLVLTVGDPALVRLLDRVRDDQIVIDLAGAAPARTAGGGLARSAAQFPK